MTTGKRAENRARQDAAILETAERMLATEGAQRLTLRGVAAAVGMVPSAIYRYHPGIDALLTALIIRAYEAVGDAAHAAGRAASGTGRVRRVLAVAHGVRDWALANPHRYALIYGSPVPGYEAPPETVAYAGMVADALLDVLREEPPEGPDAAPPGHADAAGIDPAFASRAGVRADLLPGALDLFTTMSGAISLELFGHYTGVLVDPRTHFDSLVSRRARALVGL